MHQRTAKTLIPILIMLFGITGKIAAMEDGKRIATQGNNQGAVACIACHGQNGLGSADYPYLAQLPEQYIKSQLVAFREGSRANAVMKPIASALDKKDIAAVSKYYANLQNSKLSTIPDQSDTGMTKGKELAYNGKWETGVPSCFKCHGPNGTGVPESFPPITGQPYKYIKNQLVAWKQEKRNNDPIGLMQSVANGLDDNDIDAVARYLASMTKQ